jgi:hypothetical protein
LKHEWATPTLVTIEAARCDVCGALDWDYSRTNEDCSGADDPMCPNCKCPLEDGRYCETCGHTWPQTPVAEGEAA